MEHFDRIYSQLLKEYSINSGTSAPAKPTTKPTTTPTTTPSRPQHPLQPRPGIQPRPKAEENEDQDDTDDVEGNTFDRANPDVELFLNKRAK